VCGETVFTWRVGGPAKTVQLFMPNRSNGVVFGSIVSTRKAGVEDETVIPDLLFLLNDPKSGHP